MASKLVTDSKILSSKLVLCDIEGTTTSISFVKETLFPYALKNAETYLKKNWDTETAKAVIEEIYLQSVDDVEKKMDGAVNVLKEDSEKTERIESIIKSVEWMMSCDRKVGSLKTLQGLIWEDGYKNDSIKGHVYEDVPRALENWTSTGHKIYIYSSGSVQAQKLLFEYSEHGNLLEHFTGHFDTKIGLKQEKESYDKIIKEVDVKPEEILFLTDVVKEAEAAKSAGMNVCLLDRPGNASFSEKEKDEYIIISSFADIQFESNIPTKRKIEDITEDRPSKIAKTEENGKNDKEEEEKVEDKNVKETNGTDEEKKTVIEEEKTIKNKDEERMEIDEPIIEFELIQKTDSIKTESKIEVKTQKTEDGGNDSAEQMEVDGADINKDKCANVEKEKNEEVIAKDEEIEKAEKKVEKKANDQQIILSEENKVEKDNTIVCDEKKEEEKIDKEQKEENKIPTISESETKMEEENVVTDNDKEDVIPTPDTDIIEKEENKKSTVVVVEEKKEEKVEEIVIPDIKENQDILKVDEKINDNKKEEEIAVCNSPEKTKKLPEIVNDKENQIEPTDISEMAAVPEATEVKIPTEDNAKIKDIVSETEVLDKKIVETVDSPKNIDDKEKNEQISTENKIEITVTPAEATVTSSTTNNTIDSTVSKPIITNDKSVEDLVVVTTDKEEKDIKESVETCVTTTAAAPAVETNGVETNGKSDEKSTVEKNGNDSDKENNDNKNGDVKDDKESSNAVTTTTNNTAEMIVKKCKDVPSPLPTTTTPVESET